MELMKKILKKKSLKKETATAIPQLERAMQETVEKRVKRGYTERVLHPQRCKERPES